MSAYMTHQQLYARDAAACGEYKRLNQGSVSDGDRRRHVAWLPLRDYDRQLDPGRVECSGTLRFDEYEPTLAVCDVCNFEVAVPQREKPEERIAKLFQRSGLPVAFIDKPFNGSEANAAGREACQHFVDRQDKAPALHGPAGVGKTHLLVRTGAALVRRGTRVVYRDLVRLLREERDWIDRHQGVQPVQLCIEADVLILDDLGAERSTPWAQEQLQWIVDERYKAGDKPLLIATNVTLENWPDEFGERIASRLAAMTRVTSMGGVDMRLLPEESLA